MKGERIKIFMGKENAGKPGYSYFLVMFPSRPMIRAIFHMSSEEVYEVLNPFPNKLWILCVCNVSLLKTQGEKEKLLITVISPFPTQCFLSIWKTFSCFNQL